MLLVNEAIRIAIFNPRNLHARDRARCGVDNLGVRPVRARLHAPVIGSDIAVVAARPPSVETMQTKTRQRRCREGIGQRIVIAANEWRIREPVVDPADQGSRLVDVAFGFGRVCEDRLQPLVTGNPTVENFGPLRKLDALFA